MSVRIRHGGALTALLSLLAVLPLPARAQTCSVPPFLAWNTYWGGSGADEVEDVAVFRSADGTQDALYVTGRTDSPTFPGAKTPPYAPNTNAFVSKLSADGTRVEWTRILGTEGTDFGVRLALGPAGEVYVVGRAEGANVAVDNAASVPLVQAASAKGDGFLARLDAAGTLSWFLFVGGAGSDEALGVTVDGGKVYVVGRTASDPLNFSASSPKKLGKRGSDSDAFILQVDVSGTTPVPTWYRLVGTATQVTDNPSWVSDDAAYAVSSRAGTVYVGGVARGDIRATDFTYASLIKGSYTKGSAAGFVLSVSGTGEPVNWFSYLGGEGNTQVRALLQRRTQEMLLAVGDTNTQDFPSGWTSSLPTSDAFVQGLSVSDGLPTSDWKWRMDVPGEQRVQGAAALDAAEQLYLGGTTKNLFEEGLMTRGFNPRSPAPLDNGFVLALNLALPPEQQARWGAYVGGDSPSSESVRALALDGTGTRLVLGGVSAAKDLLLPGPGPLTKAPESLNGFLFGVVFDSTPPDGGQVEAAIDGEQHLTATWDGFQDTLSGVSQYAWSITNARGQTLLEPEPVSGGRATATSLVLEEGERYTVHLRVTNGAGCDTVVTSKAVGLGLREDDEDPRSPLGWGCGGAPSGVPLGALTLVLWSLAGARRKRSARV